MYIRIYLYDYICLLCISTHTKKLKIYGKKYFIMTKVNHYVNTLGKFYIKYSNFYNISQYIYYLTKYIMYVYHLTIKNTFLQYFTKKKNNTEAGGIL